VKNARLVFVSPARTAAIAAGGQPVQKLRTNMSLPAATVLGALDGCAFEAHFVDLAAEGWNERRMVGDHLVAYGLSDDQAVERIAALRAKYILVTSMFTFEQMVVDSLVRAIKSKLPEAHVILGGIHASVRPEWHLEESSPDFIVIGEGERTIVELLMELGRDNADPSSVRGIAYRGSDGQIKRAEPRERLGDLNKPWCVEKVLRKPDGQARYVERLTRKSPVYAAQSLGEDVPTYALYGSRGCPYGCPYCPTLPRDGHIVHHMGAARMFDDFLRARREYGVGVFYNQSDTFGFHSEDIRFLEMVRDYRHCSGDDAFVLNNPNAFFAHLFFPSRLHYQLDEDLVDLLADAGINVVTLAVETFSQRFNKKIDWDRIGYEDIAELCKLLHARGVKTDIYMMYGFPDQERQEFDADLRMAEKLSAWADSVTWHFMTLLPGTSYYEDTVSSGRVKEQEYRRVVRAGYSFFYPIEQFNLSKVRTRYLKEAVASFGPAWV
jgi:anaerobic magnesium-protoporphyrin IX monomethyl ester cyclase